MKIRTLTSEQTIARPLEEVFTFFNQPDRLDDTRVQHPVNCKTDNILYLDCCLSSFAARRHRGLDGCVRGIHRRDHLHQLHSRNR